MTAALRCFEAVHALHLMTLAVCDIFLVYLGGGLDAVGQMKHQHSQAQTEHRWALTTRHDS